MQHKGQSQVIEAKTLSPSRTHQVIGNSRILVKCLRGTLEERPVIFCLDRNTGTGNQVKAWGLVRAVGAHKADIAKITRTEEPYSRQRKSSAQPGLERWRQARSLFGGRRLQCEQGLSLRRNLRIGQVVQHATRRTSYPLSRNFGNSRPPKIVSPA